MILISYSIRKRAREKIPKRITTHGIFSHCRIGTARQPPRSTVMMTIIIVVEKNICRTPVLVFLMDREKAMAPRKPQNTNKCCLFQPMSPFGSGTLGSLAETEIEESKRCQPKTEVALLLTISPLGENDWLIDSPRRQHRGVQRLLRAQLISLERG